MDFLDQPRRDLSFDLVFSRRQGGFLDLAPPSGTTGLAGEHVGDVASPVVVRDRVLSVPLQQLLGTTRSIAVGPAEGPTLLSHRRSKSRKLFDPSNSVMPDSPT